MELKTSITTHLAEWELPRNINFSSIWALNQKLCEVEFFGASMKAMSSIVYQMASRLLFQVVIPHGPMDPLDLEQCNFATNVFVACKWIPFVSWVSFA